jgi:hypothetical protein
MVLPLGVGAGARLQLRREGVDAMLKHIVTKGMWAISDEGMTTVKALADKLDRADAAELRELATRPPPRPSAARVTVKRPVAAAPRTRRDRALAPPEPRGHAPRSAAPEARTVQASAPCIAVSPQVAALHSTGLFMLLMKSPRDPELRAEAIRRGMALPSECG